MSLCLCVFYSMNLYRFFKVLWRTLVPQIVARTAGSIASRIGYIRTDVITRCLAAIILTNFKCFEVRNSNSC
jgi:hypothetical protein